MPPNHFESEVESFLEGSHGDRTHIKRADHHTVTPLCGTLLLLGELCRGSAVGGAALGEFFRVYRHRGLVSEGRGALHAGKGGVFALHEAFQGRVVGVSEARVVQFP